MLDQTTFRRIVDLLVPHVEVDNSRRALVYAAFYGTALTNQDWSGDARTFALNFVAKVDGFGEIEPGKLAVIVLLDELSGRVGYGTQLQIEQLKALIQQGKSAAQQIVEPASTPQTKEINEIQEWTRTTLKILPEPFEWITIPSGEVTIKARDDGYNREDWTVHVPTFAISKYPITNAQFAKFVEAAGYQKRIWWTDDGWEAHNKGWDWDGQARKWESTTIPWSKPRHWHESNFNNPLQPVVGVSWFEAIAFCQWLVEETRMPIVLPNEQQWQRSAQGDDMRRFPWGNDWNCRRCNNSVDPCSNNRTSPVTRSTGHSPFGVSDMVGNVWEWCLTDYDTGVNSAATASSSRTMSGGSWSYDNSAYFQVTAREWYEPYVRDNYIGFRIARLGS